MVPVDTKIRFVITAGDVIHSWWVPALGWKMDAIPGIVNAAWTNITEPGVYRGQCAELCGQDHGFMPIVVKALPKEEFEKWLAEQGGAGQAAGAGGSGRRLDRGRAEHGADCTRRTCCPGPPGLIRQPASTVSRI